MLAPWSQTEETPKEQPQQKKPQNINQEALAICNKVESDYLMKLDIRNKVSPSTANRLAFEKYRDTLMQTCRERAEGFGYWDPIGTVQNLFNRILGGGDQSQVRDPSIPEDWPKGEPATETPVKYYEDDPGYPGSGGLMPTIPIETV